MQAILLVGGKGTRLLPYTAVFPKSLMPIGDLPILEVVVRQLRREGFSRLVFAVGHQHEMFRAFFGDGGKWGLSITYSLEDEPLGTAGPLRLIPELDENFLMLNGDVLTDLSFGELYRLHCAGGHAATIATARRQVAIDYGTLEFDAASRLVSYREKPVLAYHVSMGVYALSRSVVELVPEKRRFDFPELVAALLAAGRRVYCHRYDGYWRDIGRGEDYARAIEEFEEMRERLV
ncbi:nucleotidyltransferase family protein [bacterium]|nr:nucleotidyltransferase family protein [bacterium]